MTYVYWYLDALISAWYVGSAFAALCYFAWLESAMVLVTRNLLFGLHQEWMSLLFNIPGGGKRRAQRIKEHIGEDNFISELTSFSGKKHWQCSEICAKNMYEEVGWEFYAPPFFYYRRLLLTYLAWPVLVPLFLLADVFQFLRNH